MCKMTKTTVPARIAAPSHRQEPPSSNALSVFMGGWQSNDDLIDRRRIILCIRKLIAKLVSKNVDTGTVKDKLHRASRIMEAVLYQSAQTKQEYIDLSTLKHRLQMAKIAVERRHSI